MDKSILISASVATTASGVAIWALLKLYEVRGKLKDMCDKYNNPKASQKSLMHHYGSLNYLPLLKDLIPQDCEQFHERLSTICKNICIKHNIVLGRALDAGCSTGGLTFQLSKYFTEVIGCDTSYFMTVTCQMLRDNSETTGIFPTEAGLHSTSFRARIPSGSHKDRVKFWDEDVSNLDFTCGQFDCVVLANTLSEMTEAENFLTQIASYVSARGLLVLADTYDWANGPESSLNAENSHTTFDFLKKLLRSKWEFVEETNLPFYQAVNERKAEIGNVHVTAWKKKPELDQV